MKNIAAVLEIEDMISVFRQQLYSLLYTEPINSEKVLEMSKKLDELIVRYYSN